MREYIEEQTLKEMHRYDSFRKATHYTYKKLYDTHKLAVETIDKAREEPGGLTAPGYMAISPVLLASLIDIALQHLALGAEMYGEIREDKIV